MITATCSNKDKEYNLNALQKHLVSWKKYLLQFGSIACCIHFHYLIFYVYEFSFTWHQTKQRQNLIFAFWKLTIMTGNYVHFLILKNTKKFTNFWWLNLGTESDVSTVWIFYCDKNKCQNSNFNQKRMFTLKILISQKVGLLSCFERIRVVQLDCHPAKVRPAKAKNFYFAPKPVWQKSQPFPNISCFNQ